MNRNPASRRFSTIEESLSAVIAFNSFAPDVIGSPFTAWEIFFNRSGTPENGLFSTFTFLASSKTFSFLADVIAFNSGFTFSSCWKLNSSNFSGVVSFFLINTAISVASKVTYVFRSIITPQLCNIYHYFITKRTANPNRHKKNAMRHIFLRLVILMTSLLFSILFLPRWVSNIMQLSINFINTIRYYESEHRTNHNQTVL